MNNDLSDQILKTSSKAACQQPTQSYTAFDPIILCAKKSSMDTAAFCTEIF